MLERWQPEGSIWTPELRQRLRVLWLEGHSTAEIGRRLGGVSKNAVISRARRDDLPARPSPINIQAARSTAVRQPPRASGPTLPQLASVVIPTRALTPSVQPVSAVPHPDRIVAGGCGVRAVPVQIVVEPGPVFQPLPRGPCQFPLWGSERPAKYLFCDAKSLPGKPYCGEHAAKCYTRISEKADLAPWLRTGRAA